MEAFRRALISEHRVRERLESACNRCCPETWIEWVQLSSSRSEQPVESHQTWRLRPQEWTGPWLKLDNHSDATG